ncbi:MAG: hypothetical protein D6743_10490 [Calditrichaeota bacterium]|nr:MAG: hypothetical protein D6743_10490 [Calditrichota bacterium]
MEKADYSGASAAERERVVEILQRNVNELIEQKRSHNPMKLRRTANRFCERIRQGGVFTGKDFEQLLKLFRKQAIF